MFETLDQEYTNKRRSNIDNLENLLLFSSFMFKIYSNTMYSYTPNQSFQSNKYHLSAEIHSADFKQILIFRTFIDGLNFTPFQVCPPLAINQKHEIPKDKRVYLLIMQHHENNEPH